MSPIVAHRRYEPVDPPPEEGRLVITSYNPEGQVMRRSIGPSSAAIKAAHEGTGDCVFVCELCYQEACELLEAEDNAIDAKDELFMSKVDEILSREEKP